VLRSKYVVNLTALYCRLEDGGKTLHAIIDMTKNDGTRVNPINRIFRKAEPQAAEEAPVGVFG
jgi:hypothetical protein